MAASDAASWSAPGADLPEPNSRHVFIVGSRRIQNELMASFVEGRTGILCTVVRRIEDVQEACAKTRCGRSLVLKDWPDLQTQALRQRLTAAPSVPGQVFALFNVPAGKGVEAETFPLGFRGFVYLADAPETLAKAITALLDGELWMTRKAMAECLAAVRPGSALSPAIRPAALSRREAEVLGALASGASNEGIAAHFCISPHTVKTHVYRIFRKIGVSNRLEASLWAAKNF